LLDLYWKTFNLGDMMKFISDLENNDLNQIIIPSIGIAIVLILGTFIGIW